MPDGSRKLVPQNMWQTGEARCDNDLVNKVEQGESVSVSYDPYNPIINKLDSTGTINTGVTFFSAWLWYLLGVIATAAVIGELLKHSVMPDL
jgi:hypothetical protein